MGTHIAIIDDGIDEKYYDVGQLKYNIEITQTLYIRQRTDYDPLLPSHGTTCAAIIKKYAPNVSLSSVKVLNEDTEKGMKAQLVKALEWCVDNNVHLVNLSIGTIDYRDFGEIEAAVKKAINRGMVIVAACNNRNVFTCPASLKEVIGVKCDLSGTLKAQEYICNSFMPDGIEITSGSIHQLIKYNGESKTTSPCNSFAAPLITAVVNGIIEKKPGITLDGIKEELARKALVLPDKKINYEHSDYKCIQSDIDIPLIIIYDYASIGYSEVKNKLYQLFRIDGYNAISICQASSEEDTCNGVVSIESFIKSGNATYNQALKEIYNVYDPDIMIINIDNHNVERDCIKELEASLEIDIKIFILNEIDDKVTEHIHKSDESKSILLLTQQNKEAMICDRAIAFNCSNDSTIYRVYTYILSLFEVNDSKNGSQNL